ncbi:hypothetical protein GIB67_003829 [Kingdonia uniflora]|uniref:Exopolygalacturonase n=1 Tax=Kingdonia uniflora TaxID=39325 RepID=A0A7J7P3T7_9MAGN|nr:hypothetical protein GIB67_003829 [Kingdonia uniflora]
MATFRMGSKAFFLLLSLALVSNVALGVGGRGVVRGRGGGRGRKQSGPPATIFNVMNYGAKNNGKMDSTQAFMKAWVAACHWRGNARLVVPLGTFLTGQVTFQGPCNSLNPIVVQVRGTIKAQTDISEYPSPEWFSFEEINGLVLTGGGTFDGQGPSVWPYNDCKKNKDCQMLPTSLKFSKVTNANVRRINSVNSMAFHIGINRCQDFGLQTLKITAPAESPNTDGIHISSSTNIRVARSFIGTGDDCVSLGQGTYNVSITDVICGPGHGISIGSLGKYNMEKDVSGITVRNCTLKDTDNGVRIKTYQGSDPSKASKFIFDNIIMNNVKYPIIIDQLYCDKGCHKSPSRVHISDVQFSNIRGTSKSDVAVSIICSPQFPCQNVVLHDINLKLAGNKPATAECENVKINYGGVQFPPKCM